jgi:hypothetical protein
MLKHRALSPTLRDDCTARRLFENVLNDGPYGTLLKFSDGVIIAWTASVIISSDFERT